MTGKSPDDRDGAGPSASDEGAIAHEAELISFPGKLTSGRATSIEHLSANRSLIVRRSLLATAVGGIVPVPVMDDYLAGRVRAGLLMTIADRRRVDLAPSSAELLADPREGSAARNATMTAATLLALKLAWRKVFVLLGAGRRAEEMTTTFQVGTLFDHFCAKLHVGVGLERQATARLLAAIFAAIRDSERETVVGVFKEGGRVLGRSIGEAPAWVTRQLRAAVEQYVASGGNPDAVPRDERRPGATDDQSQAGSEAGDAADIPGLDPDARWLDRAAAVVENRLGRLGSGYIEGLVTRFDAHYQRLSEQPTPPENDRPAP
jgi:hypothetical protein